MSPQPASHEPAGFGVQAQKATKAKYDRPARVRPQRLPCRSNASLVFIALPPTLSAGAWPLSLASAEVVGDLAALPNSPGGVTSRWASWGSRRPSPDAMQKDAVRPSDDAFSAGLTLDVWAVEATAVSVGSRCELGF
jgi:hypothetical protein